MGPPGEGEWREPCLGLAEARFCAVCEETRRLGSRNLGEASMEGRTPEHAWEPEEPQEGSGCPGTSRCPELMPQDLPFPGVTHPFSPALLSATWRRGWGPRANLM